MDAEDGTKTKRPFLLDVPGTDYNLYSKSEGYSVNDYLQMRWALWNEVRRILALPYIWMYFIIRGVRWGQGWRILGTPIIQRHHNSQIRIGDGLILRSWVTSNPVAPYHPVILSTRTREANISIGANCGITGGSIIAEKEVTLGDRVLIGANCLIIDTDFHPLDKESREKQPHKTTNLPVAIGDDVFIGAQVIILKGTTIGKGSIIGAGSVVTGEIPANVVAAGNPAVVIRHLDPSVKK